ncbi:unnamed protein product [Caretta caretta]
MLWTRTRTQAQSDLETCPNNQLSRKVPRTSDSLPSPWVRRTLPLPGRFPSPACVPPPPRQVRAPTARPSARRPQPSPAAGLPLPPPRSGRGPARGGPAEKDPGSRTPAPQGGGEERRRHLEKYPFKGYVQVGHVGTMLTKKASQSLLLTNMGP